MSIKLKRHNIKSKDIKPSYRLPETLIMRANQMSQIMNNSQSANILTAFSFGSSDVLGLIGNIILMTIIFKNAGQILSLLQASL
uniref:Uncharacterized protein n=1 Tax=Romanomermis culicivorax TaxID=13658 RepID=A0A915L2U0_ROMCU